MIGAVEHIQLSLFPTRDSLEEVLQEGLALLPITTPNQLISLLHIQQNTMVAIQSKLTHPNRPANPWESHPEFPRGDWQYEVSNGDTNHGYWEWVDARIEEEDDEL